MNELIVIRSNCETCGREFVEPANFCGNCGVPAAMSADGSLSTPAYDPSQYRWVNTAGPVGMSPQGHVSIVDEALNNRMVVVAILLVAGPIGLPALWYSRRFSRPTKIITTCVYFLVTAIVPLLAAWYFLDVALRPLVDVFSG